MDFIDQLNVFVVFSSAITGIGIIPCSYVVKFDKYMECFAIVCTCITTAVLQQT